MPTIRLEKTPIKMPVIKLRFRGADRYFIIDTGAQGTMIDPEAAGITENTKLHPLRTAGVGGFQNTALAEIQFNFCGATVNRVGLETALRNASQQFNLELAGLIGQDLLV